MLVVIRQMVISDFHLQRSFPQQNSLLAREVVLLYEGVKVSVS